LELFIWQYSQSDGSKFNLARFELALEEFHITSPSHFGNNSQCSQFLNRCLLGINSDFLEGHPHPSIVSQVRYVSHFFPSRPLPGF